MNQDNELLPALESGEVHIIIMGSLTYALDKQTSGIKVLGISLNENNQPVYHSAIIVHKKSTITNLQELKGKKIAFGSRFSTSSFLIPALYLDRIGISLSDIQYEFVGTQERILLGLLNYQYDAGAVIVDMIRKAKPGTFKILYKSDPIPGSPLVILKSRDKGFQENIINDLSRLRHYLKNHPQMIPFIEIDFRYGFSYEVNENIFDPLRLAYKRISPKIQ